MDFFERHSFGEVPLLVYDEFVPGESNCGYFRMASDESLKHDDRILAFVIPHNYWEERLGDALWRKFDTFKLAIVSGTLVDGKVVKEDGSILIKADRIISGGVMLSALWGGAGIRHVDFIERAVPIPEEEEGFHDYIRRWRERELREQGIIKREIEPEEYNSKFTNLFFFPIYSIPSIYNFKFISNFSSHHFTFSQNQELIQSLELKVLKTQYDSAIMIAN